MNSKRLLKRFLEYVKIDTQADDTSDSYPSTPGQLGLGMTLVRQLHEIGLEDAEKDKHGLVLRDTSVERRASVRNVRALCPYGHVARNVRQ